MTQEVEVATVALPPPAPRDDFDARVVARFDTLLETIFAEEPELLHLRRVFEERRNRNTYLAALQRLKRSSGSASYIKMLRFAWRYTSLLDCSSLDSAKRDLTETNAFVDPTFAEIDGVPLILPSRRDKPRA